MFISAGGYLLNSVSFGSGERAFVAHGGWVGNWELWQEPFRLMQDAWRCVGYDHRGSGVSTAPPEAITPEGQVDDLFAVLDHFGIEQCVLAGESLGALPCLQAVIERPERFAGLVLVDGVPAAVGDNSALINGSRANYPATVGAFVDACVPEPDSDHLKRWGRQILLRAEPEAAARMLEAHYERKVAPALPQVSVPTLVIHGELDAIVPVAAAQSVAAAVPDAELVVLPGAGHVPTITRPQEVVDVIDRWAVERGLLGAR